MPPTLLQVFTQIFVLHEDLIELFVVTEELLGGGEVAPHAHVGVVHVDAVAVVDARVVARVAVVPLVHLRTQVVLVAHHLDPLVQPVQLVALRVADGRLHHHGPVADGHDVRGVALHQHALLLHHVLVLVRHRLDELLGQRFEFGGEDGFNLGVQPFNLGLKVLVFRLVDLFYV